jgi:hypothetical protein
MMTVADRGGADAREVRAGAGFGHRDGGEQSPGRQPGKPALALRPVG